MLSGRELPLVQKLATELQTAEGLPVPALGAWDFLTLQADNQLGLVFAKLFWPEFVVVDRLIFLKELFDEAAWSALPSIAHAVQVPVGRQASFNLQKIWDLFPLSDPELDSEVNLQIFSELAGVLCACWQSKVNREFPEAEAGVELNVGGYGPELSLSQAKFC